MAREPRDTQSGLATGLALWSATLSAALVAALCVTLSGASSAGAASSPEQEVDALLARLSRSPCSFWRNDQWHDGATASAHLRRKWRKGAFGRAPGSAEQFIELAASRSSETGAPYAVRCPGESEQPAGPWLLRHLEQLRRGSGLPPSFDNLAAWSQALATRIVQSRQAEARLVRSRDSQGALASHTVLGATA